MYKTQNYESNSWYDRKSKSRAIVTIYTAVVYLCIYVLQYFRYEQSVLQMQKNWLAVMLTHMSFAQIWIESF